MAYAYNGPAWIEVMPSQSVVINGVASSYETVMAWSSQMRTSRGVKTIVDDTIPAGKVATGSSLVDDNGSPRRVWDLADAPPPAIPDGPTLSDWRVALRLMGRFDEVDAAVNAALASGAIDGAIAYERFTFANHIYRAELLRLAPTFGFSEADIDQSLVMAAQVATQAAA